jgi:hypothetical protein
MWLDDALARCPLKICAGVRGLRSDEKLLTAHTRKFSAAICVNHDSTILLQRTSSAGTVNEKKR